MGSIEYIGIYDFILLPIYLGIIYLIVRHNVSKRIAQNPEYKYYISGLFARIASGIVFCFIYVYVYGGGDTTEYFRGGVAMYKLAFYDTEAFFFILKNGISKGPIYYFFEYSAGVPPHYMMDDSETFFVIRFISPIMFLSAKSFIIATVFMSWYAHVGIWRLYTVFLHYFPQYQKQLALSIIFFPSLLFWGSGIMKDTITLGAAGWFTFCFFKIFIKKEQIVKNVILLIIFSNLILAVKPFIFMALLPGSIIWLMFNRIKSIENKIIRFLATPALIVFFTIIGAFLMSFMSSSFGDYSSLDKTLEKAAITQQDLIREEAYGGGSYNIGVFEPTLAGILPKFPLAITAGLFRPFIWEARNPIMMISGLENFILLLLVLYCFFKVGIFRFFNIIFDEPLLIFSFVFSIVFAFSVGLTSANFGALVRYKIPLLPFFVGTLVVTLYKVRIVFEEIQAKKKERKFKNK